MSSTRPPVVTPAPVSNTAAKVSKIVESLYQPSPLEEAYGMYLLESVLHIPYNVEGNILLSGKDAVPFLSKSGVNRLILRNIWTAVDPNNIGTLTKTHQFHTIVRLIALAQEGGAVSVEGTAALASTTTSSNTLTEALNIAYQTGHTPVEAMLLCLQQTSHLTNVGPAVFEGVVIPDSHVLRDLYYARKNGIPSVPMTQSSLPATNSSNTSTVSYLHPQSSSSLNPVSRIPITSTAINEFSSTSLAGSPNRSHLDNNNNRSVTLASFSTQQQPTHIRNGSSFADPLNTTLSSHHQQQQVSLHSSTADIYTQSHQAPSHIASIDTSHPMSTTMSGLQQQQPSSLLSVEDAFGPLVEAEGKDSLPLPTLRGMYTSNNTPVTDPQLLGSFNVGLSQNFVIPAPAASTTVFDNTIATGTATSSTLASIGSLQTTSSLPTILNNDDFFRPAGTTEAIPSMMSAAGNINGHMPESRNVTKASAKDGFAPYEDMNGNTTTIKFDLTNTPILTYSTSQASSSTSNKQYDAFSAFDSLNNHLIPPSQNPPLFSTINSSSSNDVRNGDVISPNQQNTLTRTLESDINDRFAAFENLNTSIVSDDTNTDTLHINKSSTYSDSNVKLMNGNSVALSNLDNQNQSTQLFSDFRESIPSTSTILPSPSLANNTILLSSGIADQSVMDQNDDFGDFSGGFDQLQSPQQEYGPSHTITTTDSTSSVQARVDMNTEKFLSFTSTGLKTNGMVDNNNFLKANVPTDMGSALVADFNAVNAHTTTPTFGAPHSMKTLTHPEISISQEKQGISHQQNDDDDFGDFSGFDQHPNISSSHHQQQHLTGTFETGMLNVNGATGSDKSDPFDTISSNIAEPAPLGQTNSLEFDKSVVSLGPTSPFPHLFHMDSTNSNSGTYVQSGIQNIGEVCNVIDPSFNINSGRNNHFDVVQDLGRGFGDGTQAFEASGWDALNALVDVQNAPLPSLEQLHFPQDQTNLFKSNSSDVGPKSQNDDEGSDSFGNFEGIPSETTDKVENSNLSHEQSALGISSNESNFGNYKHEIVPSVDKVANREPQIVHNTGLFGWEALNALADNNTIPVYNTEQPQISTVSDIKLDSYPTTKATDDPSDSFGDFEGTDTAFHQTSDLGQGENSTCNDDVHNTVNKPFTSNIDNFIQPMHVPVTTAEGSGWSALDDLIGVTDAPLPTLAPLQFPINESTSFTNEVFEEATNFGDSKDNPSSQSQDFARESFMNPQGMSGTNDVDLFGVISEREPNDTVSTTIPNIADSFLPKNGVEQNDDENFGNFKSTSTLAFNIENDLSTHDNTPVQSTKPIKDAQNVLVDIFPSNPTHDDDEFGDFEGTVSKLVENENVSLNVLHPVSQEPASTVNGWNDPFMSFENQHAKTNFDVATFSLDSHHTTIDENRTHDVVNFSQSTGQSNTLGWDAFDVINDTQDAPLPSLGVSQNDDIILSSGVLPVVDSEPTLDFGNFTAQPKDISMFQTNEFHSSSTFPSIPLLNDRTTTESSASIMSSSDLLPSHTQVTDSSDSNDAFGDFEGFNKNTDETVNNTLQEFTSFDQLHQTSSGVSDSNSKAVVGVLDNTSTSDHLKFLEGSVNDQQVPSSNMQVMNSQEILLFEGGGFGMSGPLGTSIQEEKDDKNELTNTMKDRKVDDFDDFGDFTGFTSSKNESNRITQCENVSIGAVKNTAIVPDSTHLHQETVVDDDDFGDFSTFQDSPKDIPIMNEKASGSHLEVAVQDIDPDVFGDFNDFQSSLPPTHKSSDGHGNPRDSSTLTEGVEVGSSRIVELNSSNRVSGKDTTSFPIELGEAKSTISALSNQLPTIFRKTCSSEFDLIDISVCIDKSINTDATLNDNRRFRIQRCITLLHYLTTSSTSKTSVYWDSVITIVTEELGSGLVLLKEAIKICAGSSDRVLLMLQKYIEGLAEFVRVIRFITATIGDLLMLDDRVQLNKDTLPSSWYSMELIKKVLEVERLWEAINMIAVSALKLKPTTLLSVAEVRIHNSTTEFSQPFCHFTLQPLAKLSSEGTTTSVVHWGGHTFMACAANILANKCPEYEASQLK